MSKNLLYGLFGLGVGIGIGTYIGYRMAKSDEILEVIHVDYDAEPEEEENEDIEDSKEESQTEDDEEYGVKEALESLKNRSEKDKPRLITADEYGLNDNYELVELTLYADKVVVDEDDEEVNSVGWLLGWKNIDAIAKSSDDEGFIVNDEQESYFSIIKEYRDWHEWEEK